MSETERQQQAPLSRLGHFMSDVVGSAVGISLSKRAEEMLSPDVVTGRKRQLSAVMFGPSDEDESAFCGAVFAEMAGQIAGRTDEERARRLLAIWDKLFERLDQMTPDLQDGFRQKVMQRNDEGKPDIKTTATVLIGITQMSNTSWERFKRALNLTPEALGFDVKAEINKLETELAHLRATPRLGFWQRFNFFSLTGGRIKRS